MSRRAFTLVEILIVVVILGILAALVIPNFTRATEDSTKSALKRQLQSINSQIEIYRARNAGGFPTNDLTSPLVEGGSNYGWGVMVSGEYFKEAPMNPYTGSRLVVAGTEADAIGHAGSDASAGWYYLAEPAQLVVFAAGYDADNNLFSHETAP
jgi:general secretion pathway protein G